MAEEMSTSYLLALISDRVTNLKNMIKKIRIKDRECKDWDGYDSDMLLRRLDWTKKLADSRRDIILKAKGKNPSDFAL